MALQLDDLQIDIVVNATAAEKSISKLAGSLKTLSKIEIDSTPIRQFIEELSEVSEANEGIHTLAKSMKDLASAAKAFQIPKGLSDTMRDLVKLGSAEDALMRPLGSRGGENKGFVDFASQIQVLNEAGKDVSGLQSIAIWLSSIATSAKDLKGAASSISAVANAVKKRTEAQTSATDDVQDKGDVETQGGDTGHKIEETAAAASKLRDVLASLSGVAKKAWGSVGGFIKSLALAPIKSFGKSISNIAERISHLGAQIKRVALMRAIRSAIKFLTSGLKEGLEALIAWDRTFGNNTSFAAQTADVIAAKWGEVKKSFGAAAMPLIQLVQPALMAVMNLAIEVANVINQLFRTLQGYSTYMKATTGAIGDSAKAATGAAKELKKVIFGFDELNILPSDNGGGSGSANSNAGLLDFVETDMDRAFEGSLANMINNLVDGIDARELAKQISEKINAGISAVNNFLKELNFLAIGQKIGEFLTSAFENIDWNSLGQIVVRYITALPTVLIGAIQKLNLASIGTALYQFLKGALDTAIEWIRGIDWATTMYNLFSQLGDLIKNLNPIELVGKILVFAFEVLKAVISGLAGAFLGLLKSGFDLAGQLIQWVSGAWEDLKAWFRTNITAPIEAFFSALGQTVEFIVDYIFHPSKWGTDFAGGIKQIWDDAFATIRSSVKETQTYLASKPLKMYLDANIGNLPSIIGWAYEKMQYRLNNNPLEYSTTVGTTGVNSTVIQSRKNAIAQEFASGGVPDVGTLYWAGEQGSEIVANARSGRTGVMNVDQMQDAVANGNIDVVNAIYAMANMLSTELRNKDMNAYISQDAIGQAATRYQNNQTRRGVAY
jgi:hypothetical protein